MMGTVVTIDGPSASGKSSVSRGLASRLGWRWVSTGAFYRGLACVAVKERIELTEVQGLVKLCSDPLWTVEMRPDTTAVVWRGVDISAEVFSETMGEKASQISQLQEVRKALLQAQRECAEGVAGLVAEGRDCGTVVFPNAALKVFITASQAARAARRANQHGLDIELIHASQTERDIQDSTRSAAPLQVPPEARVLDTNHLSLEEAVDTVHQWVKLALAQSVKSF
jgi:cytidylate kinase